MNFPGWHFLQSLTGEELTRMLLPAGGGHVPLTHW
jgi:hypothetical protein